MRVLVCGSRGWTDEGPIHEELDCFVQDDLTIVHGAARGADQIAGRWAHAQGAGVTEEPHYANWNLYGRSAGPRRNQEMLESGVDVILAFRLPGESRGTDHMIQLGHRAGIEVVVVRP